MPKGTFLTITYAYNRVDGMEWYKVTGSYGSMGGAPANTSVSRNRPANGATAIVVEVTQ